MIHRVIKKMNYSNHTNAHHITFTDKRITLLLTQMSYNITLTLMSNFETDPAVCSYTGIDAWFCVTALYKQMFLVSIRNGQRLIPKGTEANRQRPLAQ